jgi:Zn-dependent M28 family amino/carboxypeptidase
MKARQSKLMVIFLNVMIFGFSQITLSQKHHSNDIISFNSDSLLYHVKTLSSDTFEGRRTGTKGAEKARAYIIKRFENLNVLPLTNNYHQLFSFQARGKSYQGTNLLGYIKGSIYPEDYIVISAHYDHEGIKNEQIYNGADDNASGIGALLAFAEYFQKNIPKHSIILAAFDAEELDLMGSKYFIENPVVPVEQIKLDINIDMISRNVNNQLYVVGTTYNVKLKSLISDIATPKNLSLLMGHEGKDGLQNWTYSGDHGPFYIKGIPFLYFGVEDHNDYHRPTDDFENINPEFYKSSVQTIISVFNLADKLNL